VAYASNVPLYLDPDEADRRPALLERHQRGSFDHLPLRVRMQCQDHPYWRPTVVAEGTAGGNLGGRLWDAHCPVLDPPLRPSGNLETADNRPATTSKSSGSQNVGNSSEPIVHLDTRSGQSRTPSSPPPVLHPAADVGVVQDFSRSIRPPKLIVEIPSYVPSYVSHPLPWLWRSQWTSHGGMEATIDVSDIESEEPMYSPISPVSEPTPVGPPSSSSVGIQVGPPLQRTVSVGTDVDLEVLYDNDAIAPGLPRPRLPWGVRIRDVVNYLREHPDEHVDDVLRQALISPAHPRGTQRDHGELATCLSVAEATMREVSRICVHHMCPALRYADRNHPTRIRLEGEVSRMFQNQLNRPNIPAFTDLRHVPGPLRPPQVDLTDDDEN